MIKFNVRNLLRSHLKSTNKSAASLVSPKSNTKDDNINKNVDKFNVQESLLAGLNKPTINANDTGLYKKIDYFNISLIISIFQI